MITFHAKGQTGRVSFDGQAVTITRGLVSLQGMSDKTIPLRHITSVQFRPAGKILRGFIAFSLGGSDERQSRAGRQVADMVTDENAVVFTGRSRDDFQQLADAVNAALREVQS